MSATRLLIKPRILVLVVLVLFVAGLSCSEQDDQGMCVELLCEDCPDPKIVKADNCEDLCGAWSELVVLSGCEGKWKASWDCHRAKPSCPKEDPQGCFDDDAYNWEDCIEGWCRDRREDCDAVTSKHGL